MITIGLASLVVIAGVSLLFFSSTRHWTLEAAFLRVAWIPLAALLLEALFARILTSALSYFAIAIPLFTCIASLFLTVIGATLIASARQRQVPYASLFRATIIASVPGALLGAFLLYAWLAHALGTRR